MAGFDASSVVRPSQDGRTPVTARDREKPRSIADVVPGDHLCCIYQTDDEQRAAVVPYLRLGLERGEKVLYIVDARTAETVLAELRADGMDVDACVARGQLSMLTRHDTYVRHGVFDPGAMVGMLREATDQAVVDGYAALRVTGEMTWALRGLPGSERLIEYESLLNDFLPGSRTLAICQYDRRRFEPGVLLDVLRTHPFVAVGEEVVANPYFLPPDGFRSADRPASDLARWMANLVDRKHEEDELRAAATRASAIIEQMRDGFSVLDASGVHLSVNPALCAMTGFAAEELVGVGPPHPYWPPEEIGAIGAALERSLAGEGPACELTFMKKDGTQFPVLVAPSVVRDEHGGIEVAFATIRDITERKAAEQALRESEAKFRGFVERADDGMVIVQDGRTVFANAAFAAMVGSTVDEIAGVPFLDLVSPDQRAEAADRVRRRLAGEPVSAEYELAVRRADGTTVTVAISAAGIPFAGRTAVAVVGRDVGERKAADQALRESEAQYRGRWSGRTRLGVRRCDGRIRASRRTGGPSEELVGAPVADSSPRRSRGSADVVAGSPPRSSSGRTSRTRSVGRFSARSRRRGVAIVRREHPRGPRHDPDISERRPARALTAIVDDFTKNARRSESGGRDCRRREAARHVDRQVTSPRRGHHDVDPRRVATRRSTQPRQRAAHRGVVPARGRARRGLRPRGPARPRRRATDLGAHHRPADPWSTGAVVRACSRHRRHHGAQEAEAALHESEAGTAAVRHDARRVRPPGWIGDARRPCD